MNRISVVTNVVVVAGLFALSSCAVQDEMPAKPPAPVAPAAPAPIAKAPEKAKVEKARGDVGLLDTEKNYMIIVTKEGKLITLDFDTKTKAVQVTPTPGKMADIGLGSSATVTYTTVNNRNIASGVEYRPAKGGD